MPNKVTIRVEINEARPWRPVKSFSVMLMELRARMGLGSTSKFRPDASTGDLPEVHPPPNKRVRE